jgi:DNA repair exonuclease SbcCD ATPase subunit
MLERKFFLSFTIMIGILFLVPFQAFSTEPDSDHTFHPKSCEVRIFSSEIRLLEISLKELNKIVKDLKEEAEKLKQSEREEFASLLNRAEDAIIVARGYKKKLSKENEKLKKDNESLTKRIEIAEDKEKEADERVKTAENKEKEISEEYNKLEQNKIDVEKELKQKKRDFDDEHGKYQVSFWSFIITLCTSIGFFLYTALFKIPLWRIEKKLKQSEFELNEIKLGEKNKKA